MLKLSDRGAPDFAVGAPPFLLTFFRTDADKRINVFKVVLTPPGSEPLIMERVKGDQSKCKVPYTLLLLISHPRQIPLLALDGPHFFALADGTGEVAFLRSD